MQKIASLQLLSTRQLDLLKHARATEEVDLSIKGLYRRWMEKKKVIPAVKVEMKEWFGDFTFNNVVMSVEGKRYLQENSSNWVPTWMKIIWAMIIGRTDTTNATLTWALALLLNNRGALRKARDELDGQVGKDKKVTKSDIKNLPYLCTIVKETLQLYLPAPLAAPHEAMEDCCIDGHRIPAGTYRIPAGKRVMINIWKIQIDPRIWSDPLKFSPERFLSKSSEIDVRRQHFELIPFGSGRRMCPGLNLGLQMLPLALARLIHGFDRETPSDDEPVDLTQTPGLTMPKATPLEVFLTPPSLMASMFFFKSWFGVRNPEAVSTPPEVPGRWPLIGHLPKLKLSGTHQPLARTLGDLAEKHGPLITIWVGVHRTVVVSSSEMAKECFTTNDRVLASRPLMAPGRYLGYNYAIFAFSPFGPFWREMRKIATLELLSARQLELLKHVRATEVDLSLKYLYNQWLDNKKVPIKVERKEWFGDLTFNNVVMSVVGKRYFGTNTEEDESEAKKFSQAIRDLFIQSENPIPSDAIPALERFDIGGRIRAMKKTFKELDSLISSWLKEHRLRRLSAHGKHDQHQDFLDVMLTTMDKYHFADYDADTAIKATCLTIIAAGADTSFVTLTWALSLLLNNRRELMKAQDELDAQVGKDRKVMESDIKNLPYLSAIVKETLRLYPAGPLGLPHEAMEDCYIGGYKIPAGTRVMVNIWKIQRDPRIWPDPHKFLPERFLAANSEIDVRGQHFELIPFGSGRRMCPGFNFALQILHLTLARLLHGFDVATPFDEPVDLKEAPGLTVPKATPLEVLLSPRLSADLYLK
ncbi:hypothetical protein H6P81_021003 [Aristolochia fimbriata]|uniref:Cytochrome P450 n=1 Tax=Aristolochia fimbriata TaxID=158543 RepID=A0AAV7E0B1_ARIFI|nr:hypothetical protein H6P81_021003 [Aristolochia fimbriata]